MTTRNQSHPANTRPAYERPLSAAVAAAGRMALREVGEVDPLYVLAEKPDPMQVRKMGRQALQNGHSD